MAAILGGKLKNSKSLQVDQSQMVVPENGRSTAGLDDSQLGELDVDVLDELIRREMEADEYKEVPKSMPETYGMPEKRNAERRKLSALSERGFVEILTETYAGLRRRASAKMQARAQT